MIVIPDPGTGFEVNSGGSKSPSSTSSVSSSTGNGLPDYPSFDIGDMIPAYAKDYTSTDYCGNVIYESGVLARILTGEGYITLSNDSVIYHYFLTDHLGNNRVVMKQNGVVEQVNEYYPFGGLQGKNSNDGVQPNKFGGKELDRMYGLDLYGFLARPYDPGWGGFITMDPLCEKYPWVSPYAYCMNNPVNCIDPDGRSTWVKSLDNGTYEIIGGDLNDDDLGIYVYSQDKNGDYTIRGESIGSTTSITSFYDSYANNEKGDWAKGSIINPNDRNGDIFLRRFLDDDPSLLSYMQNATKGKKYDFKRCDLSNTIIYKDNQDWYRGMPITSEEFIAFDMDRVYTSAKDIGNMVAGYVAAIKGLTWEQARMGFDGLQKRQDRNLRSVEKVSSQNAQYYGFVRGKRRLMINNFKK